MIINFQEEKERILLKKSNYICAIGIYVEFAEKIEDALFRYNLYDDIEEEEVKDLVSAMFNAIVAEYMGDQNKLDIERSIFTICNREYVFDIFLIDDESFFFECERIKRYANTNVKPVQNMHWLKLCDITMYFRLVYNYTYFY